MAKIRSVDFALSWVWPNDLTESAPCFIEGVLYFTVSVNGGREVVVEVTSAVTVDLSFDTY